MNLNTNNWKEFVFSDIFIVCKGFYNKKPEHTATGDIPFLGATENNNGVTEYYSVEDIKSSSKTGDDNNSPLSDKLFSPHALCVTNNGSVGFAFYQPTSFTCSHDVNPLYRINGCFNVYTALFVATVIKADRYRWAYGRKWRPERMAKSFISLPSIISESGKYVPDWKFMEEYIKSLYYKRITTNNSIIPNNEYVAKWEEFTVGDIFYLYNGKGITKEEIEENAGDFNAIQSGEENNGIIGKIDKGYCIEMNYTFTDEPCLTVARTGSAGFISYQQFGCVVGDSAKILLLKNEEKRNSYIYLFLKTILMANKYKYTYGRKVTESKYMKEKIMLPAIMNHGEKTPDWVYMEQYIKSLPYGDRI